MEATRAKKQKIRLLTENIRRHRIGLSKAREQLRTLKAMPSKK